MHRLADMAMAVHLFLMALVGFGVAFLRVGMQHKRTSFKVRISEALMCAFLSSAICQFCYLYFDISHEYGMPISVFIGFLGSNFVNAVLIGAIKYGSGYRLDDKTDKRDGQNSD